MSLEINCHNQDRFNSSIERMVANDPEYENILFEHPNAVDALSIAAMLRVNTTITRIELAHGDYLRDFGAEYIAESLKVNTTLADLKLRANAIGDEGTVKLAEALKINKTLIYIDLSYNNIGDVGAEAMIEALQENNTIINVDFSKVHNHVSPRNIARINALTERNKHFLYQAVDNFSKGKELTEEQNMILVAHSNSREEESLRLFPQELRRKVRSKLVDQFSNSMEVLENRSRDPAGIVSGFLGSSDVLSFNKSVVLDKFLVGRKGRSPADKYFKGLVREITPVIEDQFIYMQSVAGDLESALNLKNNIVFIADSINYGTSFSQITHHLQRILEDPKAKEFALTNPKKIGYLITLEEGKFNKAIGILNHPKLGDFVKNNPEQIATLAKVSDDPEKLLRAVHAIKEDPALRSVKAVVNSSEDRYAKAAKSASAAEGRRR